MKRILIYIHFDKKNKLQKSTVFTLENVKELFDKIIIVANSNLSPKNQKKLLNIADEIQFRENEGFDFAAWRDGMDSVGWNELVKYDSVTLMNDTCYCPIFPLSESYEKFEKNNNIDFWGASIHPATKNSMPGTNGPVLEHIQSYFTVYKKKVVKSKTFKDFWKNIKIYNNVADIIQKYETQFTKTLKKAGFKYGAILNPVKNKVYKGLIDPVYQKPILVLENKFPFIKYKVVTTSNIEDIKKYVKKNSSYPSKYIKVHTDHILMHRIKNKIKRIFSGGIKEFGRSIWQFIKAEKWWILFTAILLIPNIIVFLALYPGVYTYDSLVHMLMSFGGVYNDHQSVIFTMLMRGAAEISFLPIIFILQIVLFVVAVLFTIHILRKRGYIKNIGGLVLSLVFALFPTFLLFNNFSDKNTLFGIFLLINSVCIFDVIVSKGKSLKSKSILVLFIISSFLMYELRKNAIVILPIIIILFAIIYWKKYIKQIIVAAISVVVLIAGFSGIKSAINVKSSTDSGASMSIFIQSVGMIYFADGYVADEQNEYFTQFLSAEQWKNLYSYQWADTLNFASHKEEDGRRMISLDAEFLKNWLILIKDNKKLTVKSYYHLMGGYINPAYEPGLDYLSPFARNEAREWEFGSFSIADNEEQFNQETKDLYKTIKNPQLSEDQFYAIARQIDYKVTDEPISWLTDTFNIVLNTEAYRTLDRYFLMNGAIISWMVFFSIIALIISKKYTWLIVLLPSVLFLGTLFIAAPVSLFRYIYPIQIALPFIVAICIFALKDRFKKNEKTI